jgi:hypothetical protein
MYNMHLLQKIRILFLCNWSLNKNPHLIQPSYENMVFNGKKKQTIFLTSIENQINCFGNFQNFALKYCLSA